MQLLPDEPVTQTFSTVFCAPVTSSERVYFIACFLVTADPHFKVGLAIDDPSICWLGMHYIISLNFDPLSCQHKIMQLYKHIA